MTDGPRISVVISTYKRAEVLRQTLAHLGEQSLPPSAFEVVISDDGSPDHTREVVAEARDRHDFEITYERHANHGVGFTQNRGIEKARAPLMLLIADDIFLDREALGEHLGFHEAHPEPETAAVGRVVPSPSLDESVFLRNWDPHRCDEVPLGELPYWMFWACNISFKTDFMRRHGMFRENLGVAHYAAHEDAEVGYRLHKAGLRISYHPSVLSYHHHITNLSDELKRAYGRGVNWSAELRHLVPEPELSIGYHVLIRDTWGDHLRTLFGPRRKYLTGADRNALALFGKYLAFHAIFNLLTVPLIWRPALLGAEKSEFLARLVNRNFYRGIIFYHFTKGCRDGARMPPRLEAAAEAAK